MKKVVITGASGFLGRNLSEQLKTDGRFEVTGLTANPELIGCREGFLSFADAGIVGTGQEAELFQDALVVHAAYPRASAKERIAGGLDYVRRVFESCADYEAKAVIHISSQSVYDPERAAPAKESDPVWIGSVYAAGKYSMELLGESILRKTGTVCCSIRLASLIGLGFDARITNRLLKTAAETGKITVKEQPQVFGFLDVRDACHALTVLLDTDPKNWAPVYNLGPEGGVTLLQIADAVREVLAEENKAVKVEVLPGTDRGCSCVDASLFYRDFGFKPALSLQESLRRMRTGGNG